MRNCSTGKVCYSDSYQAEEALIHSLVKGGEHPGQPNGYYKCSICECFHLTSSSRNPEQIKSPEFQERLRKYRQASDWEF